MALEISGKHLTESSIQIPSLELDISPTFDCRETIITTKWKDSMEKFETGRK
jgi:hypothetical protein